MMLLEVAFLNRTSLGKSEGWKRILKQMVKEEENDAKSKQTEGADAVRPQSASVRRAKDGKVLSPAAAEKEKGTLWTLNLCVRERSGERGFLVASQDTTHSDCSFASMPLFILGNGIQHCGHIWWSLKLSNGNCLGQIELSTSR